MILSNGDAPAFVQNARAAPRVAGILPMRGGCREGAWFDPSLGRILLGALKRTLIAGLSDGKSRWLPGKMTDLERRPCVGFIIRYFNVLTYVFIRVGGMKFAMRKVPRGAFVTESAFASHFS